MRAALAELGPAFAGTEMMSKGGIAREAARGAGWSRGMNDGIHLEE